MNMKEKQTSGVVFPTGMEVPSGSSIRSHRQIPIFSFWIWRGERMAGSGIDGQLVNLFPFQELSYRSRSRLAIKPRDQEEEDHDSAIIFSELIFGKEKIIC